MKTKIIILMLAILLILPMITAVESYIFKQNEIIKLELPTLNNDLSKCSTCTCDITIDYPNGTNMFMADSVTMNNNYITYTIYSNMTSILGVYKVDTHCSNAVDFGLATFEFKITQTGSDLTTGQGILYFIALGIGIVLFFLSLYFSIAIPFKNTRNDNGRIISINKLKYLKIALIPVTYVLLLFVSGLIRSITANFLILDGISNLFNWVYWVLMSLLFPAIVLIFIGIIVFLFEDNILNKKIKRGFYR